MVRLLVAKVLIRQRAKEIIVIENVLGFIIVVLICGLVIIIRAEIQMVSRARVELIGSVDVIDVVVKGQDKGVRICVVEKVVVRRRQALVEDHLYFLHWLRKKRALKRKVVVNIY